MPKAASVAVEGIESTVNILTNQGTVSRDWEVVRDYLERHPDLAPLLPAVCQQPRSEFPVDTEIALELYCDPEINDAYLTIYVRLHRYDANVFERLDQVIEQFENQLERASGHLLLTSDFRVPRGTNGI